MKTTIALIAVVISVVSVAGVPEPSKDVTRMNRKEVTAYIRVLQAHIEKIEAQNASLLKTSAALRAQLAGDDPDATPQKRLTPRDAVENYTGPDSLVGAKVSSVVTINSIRGGDNGYIVNAREASTSRPGNGWRLMSYESPKIDGRTRVYFEFGITDADAARFNQGKNLQMSLVVTEATLKIAPKLTKAQLKKRRVTQGDNTLTLKGVIKN